MLQIAIGVAVVIVVLLAVFFYYYLPKVKAKQLGEQECEVKTLQNGEVIIKTEEELYFHAIDSSSIPVLVNKEEGERLWLLEVKDGN